jgi:hypothetical protein
MPLGIITPLCPINHDQGAGFAENTTDQVAEEVVEASTLKHFQQKLPGDVSKALEISIFMSTAGDFFLCRYLTVFATSL